MFHFASPHFLYLLFAIPLLALIFLYDVRQRRRIADKIADSHLLRQISTPTSWKRRTAKFVLLECTVAFLALALARPQYGNSIVSKSTQGIEMNIAIDVSNSMLAEDIVPNRLERAKLLVSTMIDKMQNDKVSLSVFAGEAYPQMPMTTDYASARIFLDNVATGMVTLQGTSVASAINLARISFSEKKDVGKALIIITDGEDHEEGALEAAQQAKAEGINVFILGIGTSEGARIPLDGGAYLTDNSGNVVTTRLNEAACKEIAQAGGGIYLHVDNSNSAQKFLAERLDELKKSELTTTHTARDEQFQAMALLAFIALLVEFFIVTRQGNFREIYLSRWRRRSKSE